MKGQKEPKNQGDHPFSANTIDEQIDHINKSITAHSLQNDDASKFTQQPEQHVESSFMSPDQRLVNGLQSLYMEETNRQIGERAWQRLQHQINANADLYKPDTGILTSEQPVHNNHHNQLTGKGITMLNDTLIKPHPDRPRLTHIARWKRYASVLTAALVALCIVGSLFWVLNAAHQSTQTGGTHTNTVPKAKASPQVESPEGVYMGGTRGVYRLNVKTGATLWHYTPPNNPDTPNPYEQAFTDKPIVDGKNVYVTAETGVLYALDAGTGKPVWTHDFGQHTLSINAIQDDSATLSIEVGGYQNAAYDYFYLYTLSSVDGTVKARLQLKVQDESMIVKDKMYVIDVNNLYVRELATGKQIWQASIDPTQTFGYTAPQIVNGITYLTSSSVKLQNGQLITDYTSYIYAFDSRTGKLLWRSDPQHGVILDAPIITNGTAYDDTDKNLIYAVHMDTGKEWWHQQETAGIAFSIQEENGILYAQVDQDGDKSTGMYSTLLAFKADGTIILQKKLAGFFGTVGFPSFIVQNGVVYTCGIDQLDAYSATDGSLLWKGLTNLNMIMFPRLTVVS